MGHIKLKFFTLVLSIFLFTCTLLLILTGFNSVKAAQAKVSIVGEPTYRLTKSFIRNGQVLGKTYEINVTLHNSGSVISDELVVNLTDQEGYSLLTPEPIVLGPDETKIISFTWSTVTIRNQQILVSFYPADLETIWTGYNSGSKTFTIHVTDEKGATATSTPGFEMIFLIIAIGILVFLRKEKNKS